MKTNQPHVVTAFSFLLILFSCSGALTETCSDGAVRLEGGPNEFEGRVEVCLGGEWGRWCAGNTFVQDVEASVVCRQLHGRLSEGFTMVRSPLYGVGKSSVSITDVSCQGIEEEITECAHVIAIAGRECDDVAAICRGETCSGVRLVNGTTSADGLVDVCSEGYRAGLCYNEITQNPEAGMVLCRQLGFNASNPGMNEDRELRYFRTLTRYDCSGAEQDFSDCGADVTTGRACSSVRLSCSGSALNVTDDSDSTGANSISWSSSQLPLTEEEYSNQPLLVVACVGLAVVCTVLTLLLACSMLTNILLLKARCGRERAATTTHKIRSAELGDIATNKNVAYAKVSRTGRDLPEGVAATGQAAAAATAATLTRTLNHEYDDVYNRSEICTNANVAYQCSS